jgi:hypothetical protein
MAASDTAKDRAFRQRSFPIYQFEFKIGARRDAFATAIAFFLVNRNYCSLFGSGSWNRHGA